MQKHEPVRRSSQGDLEGFHRFHQLDAHRDGLHRQGTATFEAGSPQGRAKLRALLQKVFHLRLGNGALPFGNATQNATRAAPLDQHGFVIDDERLRVAAQVDVAGPQAQRDDIGFVVGLAEHFIGVDGGRLLLGLAEASGVLIHLLLVLLAHGLELFVDLRLQGAPFALPRSDVFEAVVQPQQCLVGYSGKLCQHFVAHGDPSL